MTDASLRNIFSRFQNLNLLFLIRDLELGLVAFRTWLDLRLQTMCPISHGCGLFGILASRKYREATLALGIFLPTTAVEDFVRWWDSREELGQPKILLTVLRSILSERMAYADAVQRVTAPRPSNENKFARETVSAI